MNRKRKRRNAYISLRPSNIRYTQDTIANTMHVTNTKGNVIKMPLGEVVDKVLTGDIGIEAIPKISVFCLSETWYSLDNRRLWVFKKLQYVFDHSKKANFNITCVERDCEFVKMSKITTSNGGEDILVRRDPGGTKWRQLEASITDKYLRKASKPKSNICRRDPVLSFPSNVINSRLNIPATKSRFEPPPIDAPSACIPRGLRLVPHPDYQDLFPASYFHGEEYLPEEEEDDDDEWYWREANKYYSFTDEKYPEPKGFRSDRNLNLRRKVHGRRRVHILYEEEEDINTCRFGY